MIVVGAAMTLSVLVTAGCTKADPAPPASPSSTQPPETKIERETRLAFEAAEKAYRTNWAEVGRLSMAGGVSQPTKVLTATSTGEYIKATMADLKSFQEEAVRVSGPGSIGWVKPDAFKQTQLTLKACEDYRGVKLIGKHGQTAQPDNAGTRVYIQHITATLHKGQWKLSDYASEQVKSCH